MLYNCAKVGIPSGGKIDETPPQIKKSTTENYSTNVNATEFEITFDEYIKLKDLNQKLLISPPLKEKPNIRIKNKSLLIEINEELQKNTTYTFNFFDAIVDNNEENPYENFEFVFSTGEQLDSLSISGNVIKAFDLQPEENVILVLHASREDTAFQKVIPEYVSKADEKGNFRINNIKSDTFRLYALKDANMNYMYDLSGEMIAFLDSPIIFDSGTTAIFNPEETDSSAVTEEPANVQNLKLFLFNEERREQYLKSNERSTSRFLLFVFNEPVISVPTLTLVDTLVKDGWYQTEKYLVGDTIGFWITDTIISNKEILDIEYAYQEYDSTGEPVVIKDTIALRYSKPVNVRTRRRSENLPEVTKPKVTVASNISRGKPFDLLD